MWVSFSSWIWPCVQRSDWGLETGVVEMLLWHVPWRPWVQFEHCKSKNLTWPNKESELQIWKEMIFYYIVLKLRFFFFLSELYYNLTVRIERFSRVMHIFPFCAVAEKHLLLLGFGCSSQFHEKRFSHLRQK